MHPGYWIWLATALIAHHQIFLMEWLFLLSILYLSVVLELILTLTLLNHPSCFIAQKRLLFLADYTGLWFLWWMPKKVSSSISFLSLMPCIKRYNFYNQTVSMLFTLISQACCLQSITPYLKLKSFGKQISLVMQLVFINVTSNWTRQTCCLPWSHKYDYSRDAPL